MENEKRLASMKKYRESHKRDRRNKDLIQKYGITFDDYKDMYLRQKGRCAICGAHQSRLKRTLMVDHDHASGRIRALLCDDCNVMIARAREIPFVLRRGANYLTKFKK